MDAPNLDTMTTEELHAFVRKYRGSSRKLAAELFPEHRVGRVNAMRSLYHYAWNAITARGQRLSGNIQTAIMYENICDSIYQRLPEWARW